MKTILATAICFLMASLLPAIAQAQPINDAYIGINYTQLKQNDRFGFDTGSGTHEFDTGEVSLRLGGVVNKYVSSELRLGRTADNKEKSFGPNQKQKYYFDYHLGLFAKFGYPIGIWHPHILVGYSFAKEVLQEEGADDTKGHNNLHDWTFGAGFDLDLGDHFGITAEYIRYFYIGNVRFRGPSGGIYYRF